LETFALDLWRQELTERLPAGTLHDTLCKQTFFGGLYQTLAISR
jgi:hypothetical protein